MRGAGPEHYSPAYLRFHPYLQPDRQADASIGALGYTPPTVRHNLARFLTGYGRWFYVPGPVFAGGLVLALTGVTVGARRRDKLANAGLLFTVSAVLVLIPPALFATFDWRYQLPQLTLIPVAAVIGGRLLLRGHAARGGIARRLLPLLRSQVSGAPRGPLSRIVSRIWARYSRAAASAPVVAQPG